MSSTWVLIGVHRVNDRTNRGNLLLHSINRGSLLHSNNRDHHHHNKGLVTPRSSTTTRTSHHQVSTKMNRESERPSKNLLLIKLQGFPMACLLLLLLKLRGLAMTCLSPPNLLREGLPPTLYLLKRPSLKQQLLAGLPQALQLHPNYQLLLQATRAVVEVLLP